MQTFENGPENCSEKIRPHGQSLGVFCGDREVDLSQDGQQASGPGENGEFVRQHDHGEIALLDLESFEVLKSNIDSSTEITNNHQKLQIILKPFGQETFLFLTQNQKFAKFFSIDVTIGNKSFLFEVLPLFGQISEKEKIFVRALGEKIFELENQRKIIVSLEVEEKFLNKKLLNGCFQAMKHIKSLNKSDHISK